MGGAVGDHGQAQGVRGIGMISSVTPAGQQLDSSGAQIGVARSVGDHRQALSVRRQQLPPVPTARALKRGSRRRQHVHVAVRN